MRPVRTRLLVPAGTLPVLSGHELHVDDHERARHPLLLGGRDARVPPPVRRSRAVRPRARRARRRPGGADCHPDGRLRRRRPHVRDAGPGDVPADQLPRRRRRGHGSAVHTGMTDPDTFATVDPRWWFANTAGVVLTGVLAAVTGRPTLRRIFHAAVAIHVTESVYSYRAARPAGFTATAPRRAPPTLACGGPSL